MGLFDRKTKVAGVFTSQELMYVNVLIGRKCEMLVGERNQDELMKPYLNLDKGLKAEKLTDEDIKTLKSLISNLDVIMDKNKGINYDGWLLNNLSAKDNIANKPEITRNPNLSTSLETKIENYIRMVYSNVNGKIERM